MVKRSTEPAEKREAPRVKRTRGLIVRAFDELVAEKGHRGLTVQEIIERSTVNRATFYDHFRDQFELLDYFMSEAFREQLQRRLPESPGLVDPFSCRLRMPVGPGRAELLSDCDFRKLNFRFTAF